MTNNLKILPQDQNAEQAVLGSIFINPDVMISVAENLSAADFYRPAHQVLFKTMSDRKSVV